MCAQADEAAPTVSVVIPMFNEADRVGATLRDAVATLDAWPAPSEIVAVDDGSADGCGELVRTIAAELAEAGSATATRVRVETLPRNRGKGAAVRRGLKASRGAWVLMMDADNSARVAELPKLAAAASRSRAALAVGSRNVRTSEVEADPRRKLSGMIFRAVLGTLGVAFVRDTQCGFKLYRRDAADLCARLGTEDGFAFDIEHIGLCERTRLGVVEVGVRWVHKDGGSISVVRDGLRMIAQAKRIRGRLAQIDPAEGRRTSGDGAASVLELKPASPRADAEPDLGQSAGAGSAADAAGATS